MLGLLTRTTSHVPAPTDRRRLSSDASAQAVAAGPPLPPGLGPGSQDRRDLPSPAGHLSYQSRGRVVAVTAGAW